MFSRTRFGAYFLCKIVLGFAKITYDLIGMRLISFSFLRIFSKIRTCRSFCDIGLYIPSLLYTLPFLPLNALMKSPSLVISISPCSFLVSRSEEHTSELQSRGHLVCRLLLEKKKQTELSILYCVYIL